MRHIKSERARTDHSMLYHAMRVSTKPDIMCRMFSLVAGVHYSVLGLGKTRSGWMLARHFISWGRGMGDA